MSEFTTPSNNEPEQGVLRRKRKAIVSALAMLDKKKNRKKFPPEHRKMLFVLAADLA